MKNILKLIGLAWALASIFPVLAWGQPMPSYPTQQTAVLLSAAEEETLLWMREEEKVARDVYLTLNQAWDQAVFANISESEQQHMDALLKKINLFELTDPVLPEIGLFTNQELQGLYEQLIAQGEQSYLDALRVGAAIEDMDIRDITRAIEETDNLELKTTYESLLEGSKNHLRAFVGLLEEQGLDYTPQFIDQALFDAILGV